MFGETTISHVKIWFIIQLKQPLKDGCLGYQVLVLGLPVEAFTGGPVMGPTGVPVSVGMGRLEVETRWGIVSLPLLLGIPYLEDGIPGRMVQWFITMGLL